MKGIKTIIMAGGFGTRIRPLSETIPKPMLPIFNKPILHHIIELLKRHGLTDFVILLYYHPEKIKEYFKDGSDFGVNITYEKPESDLGTAGAVKYAVERHKADRYLIISGDLLTDIDLSQMIEFHKEKEAEVSIALFRVEDPREFGIVFLDKNSKILSFLEKPTPGEVISDTINAGIYLIEHHIFENVPSNTNFDFSNNLFPLLLDKGSKLYGYVFQTYWRDVGDTDSYQKAHHDILAGKFKIKFEGEHETINGFDVWKGEGAIIENPNSITGPVVLGKNCVIKASARIGNVSFGDNVFIDERSYVDYSILWNNVNIGSENIITGGILMDHVKTGRNVKINWGATIGSRTKIEDRAEIRSGVKIWSDKKIPAGETIAWHITKHAQVQRPIFQSYFIRGKTNEEITPEIAARLGAAYGSVLRSQGIDRIVIGRDTTPAARMLRRAFMGGLASMGVKMEDIHDIPLPVLRSISMYKGPKVFFKQSRYERESIEIFMFEKNGSYIYRTNFNKIERKYRRMDFTPVGHYEMGDITLRGDTWNYYIDMFVLNLLKGEGRREKIKEREFSLIIDPSNGSLEPFFHLLENYGFVKSIVSLNSHKDYKKLYRDEKEFKAELEELARFTQSQAFSMGFYLFPSADKLFLITPLGKIYKGAKLLGFILYILKQAEEILKQEIEKHGRKVGLPEYIPDFVRELIKEAGLEIIYMPPDPRNVFRVLDNTYILAGNLNEQFIYPEAGKFEDGMFTIGKLLLYMAYIDKTPQEIFKEFDKSWEERANGFVEDKIETQWEKNARLMRMLRDTEKHFLLSKNSVPKVVYDDRWIAFEFSIYKPVIYMYAQAPDENKAKELVEEFKEKFRDWLK